MILIFKASDLRGVDPEIAAKLIEPSYDPERDMTITIRRETDPRVTPQSHPSETGRADF